MTHIAIQIDALTLNIELYDTPTARRIFEALPVEGSAQVWGREIYFTLAIALAAEPDAREVVEIGEVGYWPAGPAVCLFFGPTPVSRGSEPRAYSPVNVFGRIVGDPAALNAVAAGAPITLFDPQQSPPGSG